MVKSLFNFKILYDDGQVIDLADTPFWVQYFRIDGIKSEEIIDTIEGRPGTVRKGAFIQSRQIKLGIQVFGHDEYDFDLLRDEANQIFHPTKEFYIIRDLQPGKRARVSQNTGFDYSTYHDWTDGEFEITLNMHQPFFESIGTTLDSFTFEENWQVGMNLITERDLVYRHSASSFKIWNAGDVKINPRWFPFYIKFTGVSSKLKIVNKTNNTEWQYLGATNASDVIIIDRVKSFKNGASIFGDTTHTLLEFDTGWNDIVITGASSFSIEIGHRFYYF